MRTLGDEDGNRPAKPPPASPWKSDRSVCRPLPYGLTCPRMKISNYALRRVSRALCGVAFKRHVQSAESRFGGRGGRSAFICLLMFRKGRGTHGTVSIRSATLDRSRSTPLSTIYLMRIFWINTDAVSFDGVSRHEDWLSQGIILTSGPAKYRNQLAKAAAGVLVIVYVKGYGAVAAGAVLSADVVDVYPPNTINPPDSDNYVEYQKNVAWLYDLRDRHITVSEVIASLGQVPRHACQEVKTENGRQALLALLKPITAMPASDQQQYVNRASMLLDLGHVERPSGNPNPPRVAPGSPQRVRDPNVRAWTLQRACGLCELCKKPAPFNDVRGRAFLESHHIVWLSNDGPDTVENTAAICPNCHRELHHGRDREQKSASLSALVRQKEAQSLVVR